MNEKSSRHTIVNNYDPSDGERERESNYDSLERVRKCGKERKYRCLYRQLILSDRLTQLFVGVSRRLRDGIQLDSLGLMEGICCVCVCVCVKSSYSINQVKSMVTSLLASD